MSKEDDLLVKRIMDQILGVNSSEELKIKDDIDSAKASKEEAEALKAEYEQKLHDINKEAEAILSEARKKGLIMNIKHCFLNNQETGRQRVQTYCNEQAIREIYLKPFEGALTKGRGLGIMTSYNRIGAVYAACHKPLMQNVMRGEWNYKGLIIDDALTGSNTDAYSNGPAMIYSGTDLFCLDGNRGGQLRDFVNSNNDGVILKALQRANKYVMYSISRSWMGGIRVSEEEIEESSNPWWKKTINGVVIGSASVTGALMAAYVVFEILDKKNKLGVQLLGRGYAWLDTGTPDGMLKASNFVSTVQDRQGFYVSCIEEIAYRRGFINLKQLEKLGNDLANTEYGQYILDLVKINKK